MSVRTETSARSMVPVSIENDTNERSDDLVVVVDRSCVLGENLLESIANSKTISRRQGRMQLRSALCHQKI